MKQTLKQLLKECVTAGRSSQGAIDPSLFPSQVRGLCWAMVGTGQLRQITCIYILCPVLTNNIYSFTNPCHLPSALKGGWSVQQQQAICWLHQWVPWGKFRGRELGRSWCPASWSLKRRVCTTAVPSLCPSHGVISDAGAGRNLDEWNTVTLSYSTGQEPQSQASWWVIDMAVNQG